MPIIVAIQGAQRLKDVSAKLKAAGRGDLEKQLRAAIRKEAGPALDGVRSAILALDIKGTKGGGRASREEFAAARVRTEWAKARARRNAGLRATIAAATNVKVRARGVTIEVNGARMPPDQRTLPMATDSTKGWNHPVYGNREIWAHQIGGEWFYKTLLGHAEKFRQALNDAMDDVARRIEE